MCTFIKKARVAVLYFCAQDLLLVYMENFNDERSVGSVHCALWSSLSLLKNKMRFYAFLGIKLRTLDLLSSL